MNTKRRILVTMESRATIGYSANVIRAIQRDPRLELATLVTGMHLVEELGNSIDLIRAEGFPISAQVPMHAADQSRGAWSRALGNGIAGFADAFEKLAPDVVLLSGDRVETFGCCVAAAYMGVPIAHIQAGDKSGHIDDAARHAIGKFAHIHFASCEDSVSRLRSMGEQEFRIFNVGAPQLDSIVGRDFSADSIDLGDGLIDLSKPYLLVLQHPVLTEVDDARSQMEATIQACLSSELPVMWIYPNSDLGYRQIIEVAGRFSSSGEVRILRNVARDHFLTLLANCGALVGNSSSGLLEAPSFRIPVVNVGNRQRGRPQASNIINCGYSDKAIAAAIDTALHDSAFRATCATAVNPFGDGKSSDRICEVLRDIPIDARLMDKECTY